jgi:hypothetical protein
VNPCSGRLCYDIFWTIRKYRPSSRIKKNLFFYRRYIDDIFGVWIPPKTNKLKTWNNFNTLLNNWGNLRWEVEAPSTTAHFLDLNVTLNGSTIITSTHQKPLNLYLYLPTRSAHPSSCLKGLIKGELNRYWIQNQTLDYQELVAKFITHLANQGYNIEHLTSIIQQAAASLDTRHQHTHRN